MVELPPVESTLVGAIYASYETAGERPEYFGNLGVGALDSDCDRSIWYAFRRVHAPEKPDGKKKRLFETGHREEDRLLDDLERAGVEVSRFDPDSKINPYTGKHSQWTVKAFGGHLHGKLDGKATGIPEAPKKLHVVECKSHNDKSFKALLKDGVEKSKPGHFRQFQIYMELTGIDRTLYWATNKNDEGLYPERVAHDPVKAMQILNRVERIITSDAPPAKQFEDPTSKLAFPCRYCRARGQCHESEFSRAHCRTCLHSTPITEGEGARWHCARHERYLTPEEQKAGCPHHLYIPALVPGEQIDAAADGAWVEYRMPDGSLWRDGPEGDAKASRTCTVCGGSGKRVVTAMNFDGDSDRMYPDATDVEPCEDCGGTGKDSGQS